jgi:hypothetical protein
LEGSNIYFIQINAFSNEWGLFREKLLEPLNQISICIADRTASLKTPSVLLGQREEEEKESEP